MEGPAATILVACNPPDADEIVAAFAGEPGTPTIIVCDGGDDTLSRFVEHKPEVVIVTATIDAGDARTLIGALRSAAPPGTFQIVLVGDAKGPVRNALDAADFAADRFVARPLSAKALRYAIQSSAFAARRMRGTGAQVSAAPNLPLMPEPTSTARPRMSGQYRAVMITPPAGVPVIDPPPAAKPSKLDAMLDFAVEETGEHEMIRQTSSIAIPIEAMMAAGVADAVTPMSPDVTAPMSVHDVPTRPVSELEARRNALAAASAMSDETGAFKKVRATPPPPPQPAISLPELPPEDLHEVVEDDDLDVVDEQVIAAPATAHSDSGVRELPAGLEAPIVSSTHGSFDAGESAQWPKQVTAELRRDDEWDAPPLPMREPTMILAPAAPAPAATVDVAERRAGGSWAHAPETMAPMAEGDTDGGKPPDDLDGLDGLDDELGEVSESRPTAAPPPAGGDFARELRKKMSLMAQRLFRAGDVPAAPPVDIHPPHDFRTEIDLAALEAAGHAGAAEVYDGDATFAGDDHGLPTNPLAHVEPASTSETTARTSESGEITRGSSDVAVLIARMFVSEFTGQVVLRRPGAEKAIYFDGGRPVFASSDQAADRMGELLFREGKITNEQYKRCRELVRESGRRMGEILVDKGFLKRRELLPAVRRHVEDIIYSLFAWDTGEYRIIPGDGAASERIRLSRHPAAMVLEGVRRKLDLATLERLLGPASTVVEVGDRDKAGTVISVADLSTDERAALAGMDGSAELSQVARATGAALVTVYQLAWAMTLLGVATVRRRGGDEDDAPALVGETDLVIDRERVRARHRLVDEADYFALLGVRRDATGFEIRRAYEAARRDFDADAFPPELRAELTIELAEIGVVLEEAFRVLKDDRLRGAYLSNLTD